MPELEDQPLAWRERPEAAAVEVAAEELARLLGYPPGRGPEGRARELADEARAWYAQHGRPWMQARQAEEFKLDEPQITLDGQSFSSPRLTQMLGQAEAQGAILAACGAGAELEREAARRWQEQKPDEYFFLETFGSAVVERLITQLGARLCAWAEARRMAVLPHYSPGYPGWEMAEQPRLLALFRRGSGGGLPENVEGLESGMLLPRKTQLAVFGLTRRLDHPRRLPLLAACENCAWQPCQYRRAAYRGAGATRAAGDAPAPNAPAGYSVNLKALRRWARERLTLSPGPENTVHAVFRYDGTTCSNLGRPLAFDYRIELGPREEGHRIRALACAPAPGDNGHRQMCKAQEDYSGLMAAIAAEQPLLGRPLAAVFAWRRGQAAAGCYCEAAGREHKWGLALETLHYALNHPEEDEA